MIKLKLYLLCAYIFSLPFEYFDPWGIANIFSITKITGLLYALVSLLNLVSTKKWSNKVMAVSIPFYILFIWITFLSTINSGQTVYTNWINISWLLCLISLFLISNDVIVLRKYVDYFLISFLISVTLVVVLVNLDIGIQYSALNSNDSVESGRLYFMGTNPNSAAMWACFASVIALHYLINLRLKLYQKLLLIIMILGFVEFITLTASRAAFIAFFSVGFFFYIRYIRKIRKSNYLFLIILGLVLFYLSFIFMTDNEFFNTRLESTFYSGDTGSRTKIWQYSFYAFLENPLGFGETGWEKYLNNDSRGYTSTHNLFFYFLVTGGVLGVFLFLLFLIKVTKQIYVIRNSKYSTLIISVFLLVIFDFSKNGGAIDQKVDYFFLALIISLSLITRSNLIKKLQNNMQSKKSRILSFK